MLRKTMHSQRLTCRSFDAPWGGLSGHSFGPQHPQKRGINACIPTRRGRKNPADHDATLYRKRHRVENLFARLKDWRRIATRYDRCGELFLSAICIAATVIFWL